MKKLYVLIICVVLVYAENLGYESVEHLYLGSNLVLKYLDANNNTVYKNSLVTPIKYIKISNGDNYPLSFASLIYLAGDFVAHPTENISGDNNEHTPSQLQRRFLRNYNFFDGFYTSSYSPNKTYLVADFVTQIDKQINQELVDNKYNIDNNLPLKIDNNAFYNCITGGGCDGGLDLITKKGLYMQINSKGFDHFGQFAKTNYLVGHDIALQTAYKAKSQQDLNNAYAIEAYADHYLTDSFASGHIRTPIKQISQLNNEVELDILEPILNTVGIGKGDILLAFAKIMHDTDNKNGLYMKNYQSVNIWKGYGDDYLFIKDNKSNLDYINVVLQIGIDQIFTAYVDGINHQYFDISANLDIMSKQFPDYDFVTQTNLNSTPLFAVINGYLYEDNIRDWSNGSTGIICALNRHLEAIITDKSTADKIHVVANQYCYNTIYGFSKAWDYIDNTANIKLTSGDGSLSTKIIDGSTHIGVNMHNQPNIMVKPIIYDNKGNVCRFRYPILVYKLGTYTSLDEINGNSKSHRGVTIGSREYLNCSGGKRYIYYSASSINQNQYFGFANKEWWWDSDDINLQLCSYKDGTLYLSNEHNNCAIYTHNK